MHHARWNLHRVAGAAAIIAVSLVIFLAVETVRAQKNPSVTAPGNVTPGPSVTPPPNVTPPSTYLNNLYIWFLGFVGIAALFAIVTGGVMYMLAGANIGSTQQAKKWILNGVWGIVLAAASVLLLRTINPDLVTGFDIQKVIDAAVKNQPK